MFLALLLPGSAYASSKIDASYVIRPDLKSEKLFVKATFNNVPLEKFVIGFSNGHRFAKYQGWDLSKRIKDLEVATSSVRLIFKQNDKKVKLYEIDTGGKKSFTLHYTLDTSVVPYETAFTGLTKSTLYIPGLDFFIRFYLNIQESQDSIGFGMLGQYTIRFEDLPSNWEIVSTYTQVNDNTVVIDNLRGGDVLLNVGDYRTLEVGSDKSKITVGLDRSLKIDHDLYVQGLKDIFQHFYDIYQHVPYPRVLMIVNQNPRLFRPFSRSLGGQVKEENIINILGWGLGWSPNILKSRILGHLAHEGHHIWLSHGYKLSEDWYWFQEGFTEYISKKTIYTLGISDQTFFHKEIAKRYAGYNGYARKNEQDLVQISLNRDVTQEEFDMNYDKGLLVAYLMDKQLQKQGKNIELFLGDIYRTYAVPQIDIGNREIIEYINDYLGDDEITKKYILGTETIPLEIFEFGWKYYWWSIERILPPVSFPNNLLIGFGFLMLLLLLVWGIFKMSRKLIALRKLRNKAGGPSVG